MSFRFGKHAGVTLLEMMIVIVVIGILAVLAAPKLSAFLALQRLSGDANRIFTDIQLARTLAAKSSARHYVVFSGSQWYIYRENTGNLAFDGAAAETFVKSDTLSPFVQFGIASGVGTIPSAPSGATGFSSMAVPANGMSAGAANDNCVNGATSGTGSWDSVVVLCGGRGISVMGSGALYLTTANAPTRVEAILYNASDSSGSYALQHWTYEGGTWTKK
jgi:prepilin-type N-terminal cleavage/methylation domain-containing protein